MTEHIQIGDITPRIQHLGDGEQTVFAYPFPIFKAVDMEVRVGSQLLQSGYEVEGAGQSQGGSIIFSAAPGDGQLVTLRRRLAISRTSDFQESGDFRAKVINDQLDYLTAALQQVADDQSRSPELAPTVAGGVSLTLSPEAGRLLAWNDDGDAIVNRSTGDLTGPQGPKGDPGDMSGANNLAELTDPVQARENLGLVIGTDVLAPDGDGSGLGGISAGAAANDRLFALYIAALQGDRLNMTDGIADPFADETDVSVKEGAAYVADDGGYYHNPGITQVAQGAGAAIGDLTSNGGLAAAFDGNSSQARSACAYKGDSPSGNIGKDWGSGNEKSVSYVEIHGSTDYGFSGNAASLQLRLKFQGSTDNFLSSVVDLGAIEFTDYNNATMVTIEANNTTAYRYHRVLIARQGGENAAWQVGELRFFEEVGATNMTVESVPFAADLAPTKARIAVQVKPIDEISVNVDLVVEVSRDAGANWQAADLSPIVEFTDGAILFEDVAVDLTEQPSDTDMRWRIRTFNGKLMQIHGVVLQWGD